MIHSKYISVWPRIAIEQNSGATAIVWTNYKWDNEIKEQTVYARFLRQKGKKWKFDKSKKVGPKGYCGAIAVNTKDENFLIVWDDRPRNKPLQASNIRGKLYTKKGKQQGGLIIYKGSPLRNEHPNVIYNEHDNNYLVVWQRGYLDAGDAANVGAVTALLDYEAKMTTSPRLITAGWVYQSIKNSPFPIAGQFNTRGKRFQLLISEDEPVDDTTSLRRYYFYKVDRKGKLLARSLLNSTPTESKYFSSYGSVTAQNKGKGAFNWVTWADNGTLNIRKATPSGNLKGRAIELKGYSGAWTPGMAYSPSHNIYLIVSDCGAGLVARFVDSKGKYVGDEIVMRDVNNCQRPAVAWHELLGQFIVVYVERIGAGVGDKLKLSSLMPPA